VQLWDLWGMTRDNYVAGELRMVAKGVLPETGWDMNRRAGHSVELIRDIVETRALREVQAVILFMAPGSLDNPVELSKIQQQLEIFKEPGIELNPIIVLSLIDKAFPAMRDDPRLTPPELDAVKQRVVTELGVPRNRIFHKLNYQTESQRHLEIDRQTFLILETAFDSARQRIEHQEAIEGLVGVGSVSQHGRRISRGSYERFERPQPPAEANAEGEGGAPPPSSQSQPPAAAAGAAAPMESTGGLCVICLCNPAQYSAQRCGHMCLCAGCVRDFREGMACPVCREPMAQDPQRIFLS
jgi:hypothetical protein